MPRAATDSKSDKEMMINKLPRSHNLVVHQIDKI